MPSSVRLISAASLILLSASPMAATVTYTDSATFLSALAPGYYTEDFTPEPASNVFSSGGFGYTLSAPGDIYYSGTFAGANLPYDTLTITFAGGNVHGVGGNFFATLLDDDFFAAEVTVALNDGTSVSFTPSSESVGSFRGFTSDAAITSMTFSVNSVEFESLYPSLDNLTVGTVALDPVPVPEPTSLLLAGLGLAGVAASRRRRA